MRSVSSVLASPPMEPYKQEFIDFMLACEVLTFGDFVTKSGRC